MKVRVKILAAAAAAMAAGLAVLGSPATSQAAVTSYSYVAQPQGGVIVPGTSNTVNLYLQEVQPAGATFTAAGDGGLFGAGVALIEQPGGSGVSVTNVANNTSPEPAGFTGNNINGFTGSALWSNPSVTGAFLSDAVNNADTTAGVAPVSVTHNADGSTTSLFLLGSTTLNVGATPNATFKVESFNDVGKGVFQGSGSNGNTLTFNSGDDLDQTTASYTGANGNASTFVVGTPVPEPASMAVFALGAAGLLARRRRKSA